MNKILSYSIFAIVLCGCSREEVQNVPKPKSWVIDQLFWYVENEDGSKACLIQKKGVKEIIVGKDGAVTVDIFAMNRLTVKGLFTIVYEDGDDVVWSNGNILVKPTNDKWIVIK